ncbi:MAG TPA: hypothetical protein VL027_05965 [Spongiibacteraceae bacterium]|jgi:hypothetical protein|nr:hypothetical protein [Spongiibacteraceae bacterium]HUH37474.1 hypothetical protein [Spongiibacteraceae bacterium]
MRTLKTLLATTVLATGASLASAASVDFTGIAPGLGGTLGPSVTVNSSDMSFSVTATVSGAIGNKAHVSGYALDGFGVGTYKLFSDNYYAIQGGETLHLSFDQTVDVGTLKLRQWEGPDRGTVTVHTLTGSQTFNLAGDNCGLCTGQDVALNVLGVTRIDVTGVYNGKILGIPATQFFVAGFSDVQVSEIPVPAAAWLFGSALAGLGGIARKRGQKTRK